MDSGIVHSSFSSCSILQPTRAFVLIGVRETVLVEVIVLSYVVASTRLNLSPLEIIRQDNVFFSTITQAPPSNLPRSAALFQGMQRSQLTVSFSSMIQRHAPPPLLI